MDTAAQRSSLTPPPTPGLLRGLALAILAHLLLLAGLTVGVNWKTDTTLVTAEAELWSAVPQQAAPRLVEAPPPPPVTATPEPAPLPRANEVSDADIAAERDKQRKLKRDEAARALALQADQARQRTEAQKLAQQQTDKLRQDKKKAQEQQAALDQKAAEKADAKAREVAAAAQAKAEEARRQANISRAAGLAGATGSPGATGTALRSSGPSAGYGGRIRARIKPNIVFTDDMAGNPTAEVEVRAAPDGTIVGRKLIKSSGNAAWDEAILKAIDKTEVLPRDTDGTVPSPFVISFRPKD